MVEEDAFNVGTTVQETLLGLFVRAIDLEVVFELALAHQARVERLVMIPVEVPMALEKAAAVLGQTDGMVAVSGHARGLDQPLFPEVPQVAGPGVSRAPIVISEITTGDYSECTYGCERPGFRTAQRVFAISVVNELPLWSARQVNMSAEYVRNLAIAFSVVTVPVGPSGIVIAIAAVLV